MRLAKCFLAVAALAMFGAAAAQDYPAKPIRAIVPFPPGGVVDIVARTVGQKMSEGLGQALVVENRGGAGGSIGTDVAAKAPADGYNVLFAFDTHAVNPHIYKTIRFDTLKDFAPVALIVNIPLVVAALPSFPASSMKELVDLARAKPGAYSYASVGAGSSGHLATEQFKLLTGIDLVHVPYKGGAPAVTDLLGGQINLAVIAASAAVPHLRAGRLKGLAVSGATLRGVAERPDHGGVGLSAARVRRLGRPGRPGGNARAGHRATECRGAEGDQGSRPRREARRAVDRGRGQHA